ncbi:hypothetical protein Tco_0660533 [Tanacetum coccineum]
MSGSEPGEMAPESSRAVVLPKFDMHIYTSELTSSELKTAVEEYCIPLDLHPHRRAITDAMPWRHGDTDLHDDFPTNFSASDAARLSEVLVPLRPPPRHLLYVCGLTTACRHPEMRYDIKDQHNNVVSMDTLKLPSWTGTVVSRGDPIPDDQRPKLRVTPPLEAGAKIPDLTAFQKNLEKPNSKIVAARERKEKQNLAKAEAKRGGAEANEGPKKKRKVQKHNVSIQSGSEGTLSVTPLHQAEPEVVMKSTSSVDAAVAGSHVEKEVVDLSGNTRVPTPPAATTQPSAHTEPPVTRKPATSEGYSSQSSHSGHEDEPVNNRYVPNWGIRNDLRVCTFRACRELVSHLATLAEDEFLGNLSNVEVVSRAYQTLGQSVLAQGELLKRHEQLSHGYVDLVNRNDANSEELDRLRLSLQWANQDNEGLSNKLSLIDSVQFECPSRERELLERLKDLERERDEWRVTASIVEEKIKGLEHEKLALSARVAQAETDRQNIVREFIPVVVKRLHTSVEYRQSLAAPVSPCFTAGWLRGLSLGRSEDEIAQILSESEDLDIEGSRSWEAKHRELFTKPYPYIQKIADSCDLPMDELLKVSPDVPSATDKGDTSGVGTGEASQHPPPSAP